MVLSCNMFCQDILTIKNDVFKHQVKYYHFSIVKIIAERASLIQMSNIIKKLFYSVVQTSSEMLSFLHRQDYC